MLRLMRAGLGSGAYHRDNAALRDAARSLGAVRDSKVLVDTLQGLPKPVRAADDTDLRARLRRKHARSRRRLRDDGVALKQACKSLRAIRRRIARSRTGRFDWPVLEEGVQRVYERARMTLKRVQRHPTAENLHELRKQTKYLWHQLDAFATGRPRGISSLAAASHRLSDLLGDDHNLAVLRDEVLGAPSRQRDRDRMLARIDARRESLVRQSLALARRIYRDPPPVFAARVAGRAPRSGRRVSIISSSI